MNLFKQHYEKVILGILFLIFIGLMLTVKFINDETRSVSDAQLVVKIKDGDYEKVNRQDPALDFESLKLGTALRWAPAAPRSKYSDNIYSDLVEAFAVAVCPYCAEKHPGRAKNYTFLIPADYFTDKPGSNAHKCPLCASELKEPKKQSVLTKQDDTDGDGLTDEEEERYGLSASDPTDAGRDDNGDGFSNLFSIKNNFDFKSKEKHPPYWWRLHIKEIRQVELPIMFTALNDNDSDDKKTWTVQFDEDQIIKRGKDKGKVRKRSDNIGIGDNVKIDGRTFIVADIERNFKEVPASQVAGAVAKKGEKDAPKTVRLDRSKIFLKEDIEENPDHPEIKARQLTAVIGQKVYSLDKRPVLIDLGYPEDNPFTLKIGEYFTLGPTVKPDASGRLGDTGANDSVRYQLISVNADAMSITIKEAPKAVRGKKAPVMPDLVITKEGKVPLEQRVKILDRSGNTAPNLMPR